MLFRGVIFFGVVLISGFLFIVEICFICCFVVGMVLVEVVIIEVVKFEIEVLLVWFWLIVGKVFKELFLTVGLDELLDLIELGSLDGNCVVIVTVVVLFWFVVIVFINGIVVVEVCVIIGFVNVAIVGLVNELDELIVILLFIMVFFDGFKVVVVVVEGVLFIVVVITLLFSMLLLFKFVLGLKSLELFIIVVKFGKGFCLIEMLVGIFWIGLLSTELGIGKGKLWRGDIGLLRFGFRILIFFVFLVFFSRKFNRFKIKVNWVGGMVWFEKGDEILGNG